MRTMFITAILILSSYFIGCATLKNMLFTPVCMEYLTELETTEKVVGVMPMGGVLNILLENGDIIIMVPKGVINLSIDPDNTCTQDGVDFDIYRIEAKIEEPDIDPGT